MVNQLDSKEILHAGHAQETEEPDQIHLLDIGYLSVLLSIQPVEW